MKLRWFGISLLFLTILLVLSCDSDEEKIVCHLSSVKTADGTEEYVYNAENKIVAMLLHSEEWEARVNLEYNGKGQLTGMMSFDVTQPEEFDTYKLIYDGNDKPLKAQYWSPRGDLSQPPESVLTFYHDGRGRLMKWEISFDDIVWHTRRFVYDNRNNVVKIFFTYGSQEYLGLENLSFDSRSKYYGGAPELETLSVYMRLFQPGRNNPLTARTYTGPNSQPVSVNYTVGYDENRLITSHHASTSATGNDRDFDEVTYNCPL